MRRGTLNLYLIGPMGAGKSTIGKSLARELKLEFFDADQEIEKRTGADISWIFDVEGEDGFRVRESKVIDDLTQMQGIVLATGGGAILEPDNRKHLSARGTVVYLSTTVEQQIERTLRDKRRPLLQTDDRAQTLKDLMGEREPLYQEIADMTVSTDQRTVKSVTQEVLRILEQE
jgi:shikimate kinase